MCPAKAGSRGNPGLFEIGSSSFGSELLIQFPGTIQALGTQKMTQDTPNRHTPLRRLAIVIVGSLLIAGLAAAGYVVQDLGYRATGYTAKQACSLVNVTGQPLDAVLSELQEDNPSFNMWTSNGTPRTGRFTPGFLVFSGTPLSTVRPSERCSSIRATRRRSKHFPVRMCGNAPRPPERPNRF